MSATQGVISQPEVPAQVQNFTVSSFNTPIFSQVNFDRSDMVNVDTRSQKQPPVEGSVAVPHSIVVVSESVVYQPEILAQCRSLRLLHSTLLFHK